MDVQPEAERVGRRPARPRQSGTLFAALLCLAGRAGDAETLAVQGRFHAWFFVGYGAGLAEERQGRQHNPGVPDLHRRPLPAGKRAHPRGSDPFRENREQIDLRNQPAFGSAVPRVTIVEFGDLQCSYCKAVVSVLRQDIPRDYSRDVRIVFKDYPLWEIHPWAWDAAAAGRCIYKQKAEAFWPYHDWAYDQQGRLTPEQFKKAAIAFAQTLKLDTTKITACMADPDTRAEIERELQEGKAVKVTGTPSFFINGRHVEGSQSYSQMKQYINAELEYLNAK